MPSKRGSGSRERPLDEVTHVFFDAGGTLIAANPGPVEIFRTVLAKGGHRLDRAAIARALSSPDLIVTLIRPMVRGREREFYRSVNARLVEHLGISPEEVALDDIHASFEREIAYRAYPDALRCLRTLRAEGIPAGVVSNFSHRLPRILEDVGLAPYLDTVTYSFEAGAEKPHPRIFRSALARAGATPERVLMVGDSYEADYLGAREAGLHAVLLSRSANAPNPCPSIRSLDEVAGLLGSPRSHP